MDFTHQFFKTLRCLMICAVLAFAVLHICVTVEIVSAQQEKTQLMKALDEKAHPAPMPQLIIPFSVPEGAIPDAPEEPKSRKPKLRAETRQDRATPKNASSPIPWPSGSPLTAL